MKVYTLTTSLQDRLCLHIRNWLMSFLTPIRYQDEEQDTNKQTLQIQHQQQEQAQDDKHQKHHKLTSNITNCKHEPIDKSIEYQKCSFMVLSPHHDLTDFMLRQQLYEWIRSTYVDSSKKHEIYQGKIFSKNPFVDMPLDDEKLHLQITMETEIIAAQMLLYQSTDDDSEFIPPRLFDVSPQTMSVISRSLYVLWCGLKQCGYVFLSACVKQRQENAEQYFLQPNTIDQSACLYGNQSSFESFLECIDHVSLGIEAQSKDELFLCVQWIRDIRFHWLTPAEALRIPIPNMQTCVSVWLCYGPPGICYDMIGPPRSTQLSASEQVCTIYSYKSLCVLAERLAQDVKTVRESQQIHDSTPSRQPEYEPGIPADKVPSISDKAFDYENKVVSKSSFVITNKRKISSSNSIVTSDQSNSLVSQPYYKREQDAERHIRPWIQYHERQNGSLYLNSTNGEKNDTLLHIASTQHQVQAKSIDDYIQRFSVLDESRETHIRNMIERFTPSQWKIIKFGMQDQTQRNNVYIYRDELDVHSVNADHVDLSTFVSNDHF